jgi:hypothetical protein
MAAARAARDDRDWLPEPIRAARPFVDPASSREARTLRAGFATGVTFVHVLATHRGSAEPMRTSRVNSARKGPARRQEEHRGPVRRKLVRLHSHMLAPPALSRRSAQPGGRRRLTSRRWRRAWKHNAFAGRGRHLVRSSCSPRPRQEPICCLPNLDATFRGRGQRRDVLVIRRSGSTAERSPQRPRRGSAGVPPGGGRRRSTRRAWSILKPGADQRQSGPMTRGGKLALNTGPPGMPRSSTFYPNEVLTEENR